LSCFFMAISQGKSKREKTFVLHIFILIRLYNNRTKKKTKKN
jgi:hypothetical protein